MSRKDAKVEAIYNLFANEKGEIKVDEGKYEVKYIKNFSQKLKTYKQKIFQPQKKV